MPALPGTTHHSWVGWSNVSEPESSGSQANPKSLYLLLPQVASFFGFLVLYILFIARAHVFF